ncbi:MAG: hypothetical protein JSV93_00400 [Candidatus Omnitrophota bacterium]|nr:MAG: hypothetical protein JSV93_00400 [Candidatus Omnitrophota bacterium]
MDKFGFIVHPISIESFYDFLWFWSKFAKILPKETVKNIMLKFRPYRLCSFNKIRSSSGPIISGEIVALPLLPVQIASIIKERVLDLIEEAIRVCEKRGAKIVGLGGFTSVVGNEGEVLSKRVDVPLTSGNTLTAALALEGIYKAVRLMDISLPASTAAIIGATGDIGSICTKILSKKVKQLNIAARNEGKLQKFANLITNYGKAKVKIFKYTKDAVLDADIVLTATSAVTTVIDPVHLKPGAVVCDIAMPADIAREITQIRDDILVFEGGLARIAHMEDIKSKELAHIVPAKGVFGCVAETMALTFENKFEPYSIGRGNITEEKIEEIKTIAARHGIVLSDFFCGYKFFTEKEIENIKKNAVKNRKKNKCSSKTKSQ